VRSSLFCPATGLRHECEVQEKRFACATDAPDSNAIENVAAMHDKGDGAGEDVAVVDGEVNVTDLPASRVDVDARGDGLPCGWEDALLRISELGLGHSNDAALAALIEARGSVDHAVTRLLESAS